MRRRRAPLTVIAAAALLGLTGLYLRTLGGTSSPAPSFGGPWSLTSGDGRHVTDRDYRGRYVLLYFGYTSCPDICPTTLAAIADAMRLLGPKARHLQPLFITVDPAHDTPIVIDSYVRNFSPDLVGLTGTIAQIRTVEREFQIEASFDRHSIDHTAVLELVGPDGRYVAPFAVDETSEDLAEKLSRYLS